MASLFFKYLRGIALAFMLLAVVATASESRENTAVTKEILLNTHSSWDGALYKGYPPGQPELTLIRIVIPANTTLEWHTHPMPNAAYIVRGELTVVEQATGRSEKRIGGQTLPEMVGTVHRGFSGKDPVELLVFYAGAADMPLSEPASAK